MPQEAKLESATEARQICRSALARRTSLTDVVGRGRDDARARPGTRTRDLFVTWCSHVGQCAVAPDDYAARKRQIIQGRSPVYLGEGLDAAPYELEVALANTDDTLDDPSIDVTDHPPDDVEYFVEGFCRLAEGVSLSVAVAAVERALMTDFGGTVWGLEAHQWTLSDEQAVFEGVWLKESGLFLTTRVTIHA